MRFAYLLGLASLLVGVPAAAQEAGGPPAEPPLRIDVGGGAIAYPAFPGANRYKMLPVPSLSITYKDTAFISFPDLLRVDLAKLAGSRGPLSAGPLVSLRFGRRVKDDRSYLAGLANRGDTVAVGGYVGLSLSRSLAARIDVGQAVAAQQGLSATASLTWTRPVGPVVLSLGPSATVVNARYARSYYGVEPAEAARSAFRAYRPGGGLERVGGDATLIVPLGGRWSAIAVAGYGRLVGDAARSPLVRGRDGSRDQANGALSLSYRLR